jgi:hypothetical protein
VLVLVLASPSKAPGRIFFVNGIFRGMQVIILSPKHVLYIGQTSKIYHHSSLFFSLAQGHNARRRAVHLCPFVQERTHGLLVGVEEGFLPVRKNTIEMKEKMRR